jgi:hypothetical protein
MPQYGDQVRFGPLRTLRDQDVLPFRSGEILEIYLRPRKMTG